MNHTDWQIRPGEGTDLDALVAFNRAMARETEERELNLAVLTAGVQAALADPTKGRYFVAVRGDERLGCLMLTREWSDWRNGEVWWIQSVYVVPTERGRGVFRSLYAAARAAAVSAGAIGLRLYVERENTAAQAVYARLGMEMAGYLVMEECPL